MQEHKDDIDFILKNEMSNQITASTVSMDKGVYPPYVLDV